MHVPLQQQSKLKVETVVHMIVVLPVIVGLQPKNKFTRLPISLDKTDYMMLRNLKSYKLMNHTISDQRPTDVLHIML